MTNPADIARALSEFWQPIETLPEKQEVLLLWLYDENHIIRLGSLLCKRWPDNKPICKIEVDYGDAGSWVYTDPNDSPTRWMPLPEVSRPTALDASTDRTPATVDGCGRKVE